MRTVRSGAWKRASMHLGSTERNGWYSPRLPYHQAAHATVRRQLHTSNLKLPSLPVN